MSSQRSISIFFRGSSRRSSGSAGSSGSSGLAGSSSPGTSAGGAGGHTTDDDVSPVVIELEDGELTHGTVAAAETASSSTPPEPIIMKKTKHEGRMKKGYNEKNCFDLVKSMTGKNSPQGSWRKAMQLEFVYTEVL